MSDRLAVLLYGEVIGHLDRRARGDAPTFTYAPTYVESGVVPLSLRLPIAARTHPARQVEPYLRGLLPENDQTRARWADRLDTTADDLFGVLAVMGWDCPGAVQFCAPDRVDELRRRDGELVSVDEAQIAQRLRRLADQPASWSMPDEHWSLSGQQEKFALTLIEDRWYQAQGAAPTTHIVKPGIRALMHQALVEHVSMAAAAELAVDVADSQLLRFEDQWAIVVQRFDRVIGDDEITRIHQEDFCQALGRLPESKYESRGGPGLADMVRLVRTQSTTPSDDLLALADFALINLVAGAPDGHAKNISLLLAPDGGRWVAPLYDLATGLAYDGDAVDRRIALSIGGERLVSRIRERQWGKAAATLGLSEAQLLGRARNLAEQYPSAFEKALGTVADAPGAQAVADQALPELRRHCATLLKAW
ncbi:type II toxin-antitoxin system HipA family toxin [Kribbella sandramycini]|uniref:Serine/threonine-protein kinase HipA n=1 Tax=Kribbella sandramycini TaxID=60450 RepID=A0A7Y4L2S7_9ACTN|nr:type II toxin-antitoxin system HipA family toxin [Kribbella sandramycini]MBB6565889.1 serine/threonine-protein kinase HipA [Kribbella sandramycini]NOL42151.1 type II toxin-antitoxin system HipA family toxin [Kribbella sandramycini]